MINLLILLFATHSWGLNSNQVIVANQRLELIREPISPGDWSFIEQIDQWLKSPEGKESKKSDPQAQKLQNTLDFLLGHMAAVNSLRNCEAVDPNKIRLEVFGPQSCPDSIGLTGSESIEEINSKIQSYQAAITSQQQRLASVEGLPYNSAQFLKGWMKNSVENALRQKLRTMHRYPSGKDKSTGHYLYADVDVSKIVKDMCKKFCGPNKWLTQNDLENFAKNEWEQIRTTPRVDVIGQRDALNVAIEKMNTTISQMNEKIVAKTSKIKSFFKEKLGLPISDRGGLSQNAILDSSDPDFNEELMQKHRTYEQVYQETLDTFGEDLLIHSPEISDYRGLQPDLLEEFRENGETRYRFRPHQQVSSTDMESAQKKQLETIDNWIDQLAENEKPCNFSQGLSCPQAQFNRLYAMDPTGLVDQLAKNPGSSQNVCQAIAQFEENQKSKNRTEGAVLAVSIGTGIYGIGAGLTRFLASRALTRATLTETTNWATTSSIGRAALSRTTQAALVASDAFIVPETAFFAGLSQETNQASENIRAACRLKAKDPFGCQNRLQEALQKAEEKEWDLYMNSAFLGVAGGFATLGILARKINEAKIAGKTLTEEEISSLIKNHQNLMTSLEADEKMRQSFLQLQNDLYGNELKNMTDELLANSNDPQKIQRILERYKAVAANAARVPSPIAQADSLIKKYPITARIEETLANNPILSGNGGALKRFAEQRDSQSAKLANLLARRGSQLGGDNQATYQRLNQILNEFSIGDPVSQSQLERVEKALAAKDLDEFASLLKAGPSLFDEIGPQFRSSLAGKIPKDAMSRIEEALAASPVEFQQRFKEKMKGLSEDEAAELLQKADEKAMGVCRVP